jgi:dTDP-4-dehydrorhamnose 3,5-epimerase
MPALAITPLAIPDVKVISSPRFGDHRGFFSETFNASAFAAGGIRLNFVQDNHSRSANVGTVRGLHFQSPPYAQDKLVRVPRGRILDVAVDIRKSSPTFGRYVAIEISAEVWNQVLIPIGFAHGFVTLEPDTEVIYKVSNYYAPDHDCGILWSDPALGIEWPVTADTAILSDKDRGLPCLADAPILFS